MAGGFQTTSPLKCIVAFVINLTVKFPSALEKLQIISFSYHRCVTEVETKDQKCKKIIDLLFCNQQVDGIKWTDQISRDIFTDIV